MQRFWENFDLWIGATSFRLGTPLRYTSAPMGVIAKECIMRKIWLYILPQLLCPMFFLQENPSPWRCVIAFVWAATLFVVWSGYRPPGWTERRINRCSG